MTAARPVVNLLRVLLEILGVAAFLFLHGTLIPLVYFTGAGLEGMREHVTAYHSATATGYLFMLLAAIKARSNDWTAFGRQYAKRIFLDTWLIAFALALVCTASLIVYRFPIHLGGYDAHGFGASGGEANAFLLPWLNYLLWLLLLALWGRWISKEQPAEKLTGGPG